MRFSFVFFAALLALIGCQATPPARDPGALVASGTLATPLLLVGGERTVYAVVRIETAAEVEHAPGAVNLALCIDTSGSMEGAAIREARKAAIQVVRSLADGDRLAVVEFNTRTNVVLPSTELDADVRAETIAKIEALEALGTTDLGGGMQAAVSEVSQFYDGDGVNRVILIGDGVPNHPESIEGTARSAAERGISISALGLGLDYDEVLMGKIAEWSGGRFRYVKDAQKLAGFIDEELTRLNTVFARNVQVSLTAGPGVVIESVVGAPSPPQNGVAYVPLGDMARGERREIVVRMRVTPRKADAPLELLDTVVTFDDNDSETTEGFEERVYFGAHTSADEAKVAAARNEKVELAAALAEAGATTLAALELAKQRQYVRARDMLAKGAEAARAQVKRTPSAQLEKQANEMVTVAADMPAEDPPPPAPPKASIDFNDEEMPAAETNAMPVEAQERVKRVHQNSYQLSH
jgi:Ca-activated chloride channel homolog